MMCQSGSAARYRCLPWVPQLTRRQGIVSSVRGRSSLPWSALACPRRRAPDGWIFLTSRSARPRRNSESAAHATRTVPFPIFLDARHPSPGGTVNRRRSPGCRRCGARRTANNNPEVSTSGLLQLGAPAASVASDASVEQGATSRGEPGLTPTELCVQRLRDLAGGVARERSRGGP